MANEPTSHGRLKSPCASTRVGSSTATPSPVRYAATSFDSAPPMAASERQVAAIA